MVRSAPNRRPSDAGAQKPPKILQEGGGELFGIRVAHKRLQEHSPTPRLEGT